MEIEAGAPSGGANFDVIGQNTTVNSADGIDQLEPTVSVPQNDFSEQVADLRESIAGLVESNRILTEIVTNRPSNEAVTAVEPVSELPGKYPEDIDMMSRQDYGEVLVNRSLMTMKAQIIDPLMAEIRGQEASRMKDSATRQITDMRDKYDDFQDWGQEMSAILKETPEISLQRARTVARAENPEKAVKLDEKYKKETPQETPAGTPTNVQSLGSMRPNSSTPEPSKAMNFTEASNNAWNQNASGLSQALEDMME